jgi:hypothetical protein
MRLLLAIFLFLSLSTTVHAQIPEDFDMMNDKFLYLRDSSLLLEGQFTHERGFLLEKFYDKQGHKISIGRIAFYNYGKGTFANYGGETLRLKSAGYYNIYVGYSSSSTTTSSGNTYRTSSKNLYFNRGFESPKLVSSGTLRKKLSVFPDGFDPNVKVEVLEILDQMKKRDRNFWWVAGGTIAAFSLAGLFIDQSRDTPDRAERPGLRTVGLGFGAVGLGGFITFWVMPKSRKLNMKALQTYNSGF